MISTYLTGIGFIGAAILLLGVLVFFVYRRLIRTDIIGTLSLVGILVFLNACDSRKAESEQGRFALACVQGDLATVKNLLAASNQVAVNAVNGKAGPCLVSGAYSGHDELVKFLLEHRADVNVRDEKGGTPLVNAVVGNKARTVDLLLRNGADPNIVVPDEAGNITDITALKIARIKGNQEIIKLLQESVIKP